VTQCQEMETLADSL